jgi:hypothetical protein
MSVTERSHYSRRLLFEVYDHHQPAAGTSIPLREALAVGTLVRKFLSPH